MPIKFRWPQDINAIRFGATLVWGIINGTITTITGVSPLTLANALAKPIRRLTQYGKCTTTSNEIYCNNGKLVAVDDELPAGYKRLLGITFDSNIRYETGEALTGDDDVTMTLDNLSSSGKNVFGSYNGANGKNFSLYIYGSASTGSYFRFGDQLKRPKYGTGKRTITFGKSGTSGFDSDSDVTPDEFTTPANVYIGMLPNSSSAAYAGDIIGSIIVSNRLEWIPCERESDGVIGYYEKYNRNFLEPVGSGSPVSLGYDTSHLTELSVVGTPEVLTVGEQAATVENLLAVDDIKDEQDIISGTVTRRCEAVISDGTTPSGHYIGEVGEGNIIVKARETGYEGDVATFEADSVAPLNGLTVNVSPIQAGTGDPSPDNVRPISGRTSATVTRTGKNLFDKSAITPNSWIVVNTTTIESAPSYFVSDYIPVEVGKPIICTERRASRSIYYDKGKNPIAYFGWSAGVLNPLYDGYIRVTDISNNLDTLQIELGSTASAYEPYQGNTYTIQIGQTVYGGMLDVTQGKMVVDRAMVDLGTLTWYVPSDSYRFRAVLQNPKQVSSGDIKGNMLCSSYATLTANQTYSKVEGISLQQNTNDIYVYDAQKESMTVAAFKAAMSGVQLCYELATPIEITLTPTQIETLLGANNIWSDAGAVKAYVADAELIEHVTAQPLRTVKGSNAVSVTSAVAPVELKIDYYKNE